MADQRTAALLHKSAGDRIFNLFNLLLLIIFCLTCIYPFWSTFLLSFSPQEEATSLGFHIWIGKWSATAYKFAFSRYGNVLIAYRNSIIKTVVGTAAIIAFTLMAAYPLSKRNFPGRTVITIYILITMFFSGGIIPLYLLIRGLGLRDILWSLILPTMVSGFYVIIMRNFLMTIDRSYEEAAFMDGANYAQILVRVMVPLSKPVIATVALWSAVRHWNAWFDAMIFINTESKVVLQLLLRRMLAEIQFIYREMTNFRNFWELELPTESVKAAIAMITIGPIILVYPFAQKYFIRGIYIGSLKG